jgi:hypothetical protein
VFLIALSETNDAQRNAVQAIVKAHATEWWHEVPDVWVAQGHTHHYWRDLIAPVLLLSPAIVAVFQLPAHASERMWAFNTMPRERSQWLFEKYTGVDPPLPPPRPSPDPETIKKVLLDKIAGIPPVQE